MLGIFEKIFGGSQQNQQSTSTPSNMNPFTSALQGNVTGLANSLSTNMPKYSGPLNANMTGNEGDLLTNLMQMNSQGGGAAGTNDYLTKVMQGNYLPGQAGGNPFLQDAITAAQRGTMNNLETTLGRTLPGYFTAAGHMISPNNNGQGGSSAFDTAAAIATRGAAQTMGDIAANMSSTAYGQERTNQQQAAQLSQQEVSNTINTLQAESLPRMIQELGIERGMTLFQGNITNLLQLLQTMGGIAQPVVANTQQSTGTGQSTPGVMAGLKGLFSPGGSGGGATPAAPSGG